MVFGDTAEIIKDFLFPYFCAECNREGEWWCKDCRQKKLQISKIKGEDELESVSILFNYNEKSAIGYLIKQFKYGFVQDISGLWRDILVDAKLVFGSDEVFVPIPLFWRRERERGYNQAEIFARLIAETHSLQINSGSLVRMRSTLQQAKLSRSERQTNVKGAFEWRGGRVPLKVVLVDDVYTTGATMKECAKVLKNAGGQKITGFVLAHG